MDSISKKIIFVLLPLLLVISIYPHDPLENDKKKEKKPLKSQDSTIHHKITVTATMTKKAVKDCSATVDIITRKDIQTVSCKNSLNLLNTLPGLFTRRTGDFGRADVDIRGLGQRGRRIAIMVDGRPEKMALFGCAISHSFPLDNVDRIEVVKGPSSVLYGSDALGGVINILTYTPEKKSETQLGLSYGSYNTQQFNLKHGGRHQTFTYFITADRQSSDGHIKNSNYSGYSFTGKVNYHLSPTLDLGFKGKFFWGKKYEAGPVSLPLDNFWNQYERGAFDLSLVNQTDVGNFTMKVYRNFGDHEFSDGWHSKDNIFGGLVKLTTRKIKNIELTAGGDFRILGGESFSFPVGKWDKKEAALFLHNEWFISSKWILSTGFRLHHDSLYGTETVPHLGVVFQASSTLSFRGLINKGFRSPQINELYMYPPANPDLEPERVWNYEIGFNKNISNVIIIKGALFQMRGSNLIETVVNDSPPPNFLFKNIGEFRFLGLELGISTKLGKYISTSLTYSYLDTGDLTKGRPGGKFDFNFRYLSKDIMFALQGQYVRDYYADNYLQNRLPSYFLLNSRISVSLMKNLTLILDMNNLFDTEYLIFVDLPGIASGSYSMPKRNIQVGFNWRL